MAEVRARFEMVVESCATKAGLWNREAFSGFTVESGATKSGLGCGEVAGSGSGESGATKARLGNKETGSSPGEIAFTKAVLGDGPAAGGSTGEIGLTKLWIKEAAGGSTGEIGVIKAGLGNKAAAGISTGEIGVIKSGLVNKEAAGGSTGDIGVIKSGLVNKEAAGGSTGEIVVIKAGLVNKETAGASTGEICVTKAELLKAAGTPMVTEESWINYVILYKPDQERLVPKQEHKAEPMALVTQETVPESFVGILMKRRPHKKLPPMSDVYSSLLSKHASKLGPKFRRLYEEDMMRKNCCIDLHHDVLRQQAAKGYAEVGVDFTSGVKKIFVLP